MFRSPEETRIALACGLFIVVFSLYVNDERHAPTTQKKYAVRHTFSVEAWAGIEPAQKGFADPRLTTCLPRPACIEGDGSKDKQLIQGDWTLAGVSTRTTTPPVD